MPRIPVPALIIEGKSDETAQGAKDVAKTYADPDARSAAVAGGWEVPGGARWSGGSMSGGVKRDP